MTKHNILIVDKLVNGYNHIVFNASISAIISKIFKNHNVIFIAESIHTSVISEKNKTIQNLSYQPYKEDSITHKGLRKISPWVEKKIKDCFFYPKNI